MTLFDILLPDHCVLCRMPLCSHRNDRLCVHCWDALPWIGNACYHCELPLPDGQLICGHCMRAPLVNGRAIIPLSYGVEAQYLVGRLKFSHGYREGQVLGACIAKRVNQRTLYQHDDKHDMLQNHDRSQAVGNGMQLPQALVITPMSWWQEVRRGHNQARDLATILGRRYKLPVLDVLVKKHTSAQRQKNRRERLRLPTDTYAPRRGWLQMHATDLPFDHVCIVDDVVTTGQTARLLAKTLHQMGAKRVDLWGAVRTTLDEEIG